MNLDFNLSSENRPSPSGKAGDGGLAAQGEFAVLDLPIEFGRFCSQCLSEERFIAEQECAYGLVGCCTRCGEERFVPFTRTVSEVA